MRSLDMSVILQRLWASERATALGVVLASVTLSVALYPMGTRLFFGLLPPFVALALLIVFACRRPLRFPARLLALGIWLVSFWFAVQILVEVDLLRQLSPEVSVWGTIDEARCDFSYGEAIFRLNPRGTHLDAEWRSTPVRPEDRSARGWVGARCAPSDRWRAVIEELSSTPGAFYRVLPDRVVLVSPGRGIAVALYTD